MTNTTKKASQLLEESAIPFDAACVLVKELEARLDMHKQVISELCIQNGGELFSTTCSVQGTLMMRIEPPGIRFRFVPDVDPS